MSDPTSDLDEWVATYREVRRPDPARRRAIAAAVLADARPRRAAVLRRRVTIGLALAACVVLGLLLVRMLGALVTRAESGDAPSIAPWSATSGDDGGRAQGGRAVGRVERSRPSPASDVADPPPPAPASPVAPATPDVTTPSDPPTRAQRFEGGARSTSPAADPTTTTDDLESMRLLRQAERTLETDPAASLRLLDRHARLYSSSPLSLEREALYVLALCRGGRVREGKQRQQAFSSRHSGSAYAERVRRACAAAD